MSDRREAVIAAIRHIRNHITDRPSHAQLADAAIAAMQATEPTEAALDAAERAFWDGDGSPREDMRAAISAAMKEMFR